MSVTYGRIPMGPLLTTQLGEDLKGSLARVVLLEDTPLLALQGGGRIPLYPPNKVVIYHDEMEVSLAELEFE